MEPQAGSVARLVARHAPAARRFLSWHAGEQAAELLAAARAARPPDWVMAMEPGPLRLAPLIETLPPDPCLHLRMPYGFEAPPAGRAHPVLTPHRQGLVAQVVLLGGPNRAQAARAVQHGMAPDGVVLMPPPPPEDAETIERVFAPLGAADGLLALRPRRAPPPPPARPPGRCGILVTVVGTQTEAEWEITGPSVRAYAAAIGAELVVSREGAGLPRPSIKSAALSAAEAFDRVILMDADILVRPHAPDLFAIVPAGMVGAYPEGRHFPREAIATEAAELHGAPPFPAEDYFNSGVMVLDRAQLSLLRAIQEGVVGGRIAEQDTLNVTLRRLGLRLYRLEPEFNLIATPARASDWRCGWMLHTAGAPKLGYRRRHGWWRDPLPRGVVWTTRPLTGRSLRLPHMVAQAARIAGHPAMALDPDEATFTPPQALPRLMPDGVMAMWIEAEALGWAVQGRFEGVAEGRWRLLALPVPGVPLADCAFAVRRPGEEAPLASGRLAPELALDLPAGTTAVDLALGGPGAGGALAGLVLVGPACG